MSFEPSSAWLQSAGSVGKKEGGDEHSPGPRFLEPTNFRISRPRMLALQLTIHLVPRVLSPPSLPLHIPIYILLNLLLLPTGPSFLTGTSMITTSPGRVSSWLPPV